MVVPGPLVDPTPEFKKKVADVQGFGPWWIGWGICGCAPCCCCVGCPMSCCMAGLAHKTQYFEEPVDEET